MKILFVLIDIIAYSYTVLLVAVNFYYLRDDIKLIVNPKKLYIHLKNIIKTCM